MVRKPHGGIGRCWKWSGKRKYVSNHWLLGANEWQQAAIAVAALHKNHHFPWSTSSDGDGAGHAAWWLAIICHFFSLLFFYWYRYYNNIIRRSHLPPRMNIEQPPARRPFASLLDWCKYDFYCVFVVLCIICLWRTFTTAEESIFRWGSCVCVCVTLINCLRGILIKLYRDLSINHPIYASVTM